MARAVGLKWLPSGQQGAHGQLPGKLISEGVGRILENRSSIRNCWTYRWGQHRLVPLALGPPPGAMYLWGLACSQSGRVEGTEQKRREAQMVMSGAGPRACFPPTSHPPSPSLPPSTSGLTPAVLFLWCQTQSLPRFHCPASRGCPQSWAGGSLTPRSSPATMHFCPSYLNSGWTRLSAGKSSLYISCYPGGHVPAGQSLPDTPILVAQADGPGVGVV